jgi:hypothetical protein
MQKRDVAMDIAEHMARDGPVCRSISSAPELAAGFDHWQDMSEGVGSFIVMGAPGGGMGKRGDSSVLGDTQIGDKREDQGSESRGLRGDLVLDRQSGSRKVGCGSNGETGADIISGVKVRTAAFQRATIVG